MRPWKFFQELCGPRTPRTWTRTRTWGLRTTIRTLSSRILEDKDFPQGLQHCTVSIGSTSLFQAREEELKWLDMKINDKKSCCAGIGQRLRYDLKRASITNSHGYSLPWVKEIRYLGTYVTYARCSIAHVEWSNSICHLTLSLKKSTD